MYINVLPTYGKCPMKHSILKDDFKERHNHLTKLIADDMKEFEHRTKEADEKMLKFLREYPHA